MPCRRTWCPREQFPQGPSGQQGAGQDVYQQNSGDSQKWRAVSRIHEESIHAVSRALEQHCGEHFKDCGPHQRPKQWRIEGNDSRVLEESRDPESEPGYCPANQQFPSHLRSPNTERNSCRRSSRSDRSRRLERLNQTMAIMVMASAISQQTIPIRRSAGNACGPPCAAAKPKMPTKPAQNSRKPARIISTTDQAIGSERSRRIECLYKTMAIKVIAIAISQEKIPFPNSPSKLCGASVASPMPTMTRTAAKSIRKRAPIISTTDQTREAVRVIYLLRLLTIGCATTPRPE